MIMALGMNGQTVAVQSLSPKGFLFKTFQNGDLASPENMGTIDRALGITPTWIADVWAYFGIVNRVVMSQHAPDDVGDDLNCLASAVFSVIRFPTKRSNKNLEMYLEDRPTNYGNTKLGERCPVMGALAWYFRVDAGGNPELAEIWRPIVEYYRSLYNCPV
jgi:hypothetical protein